MTKVYKYGLLPPTRGADVVERQCDLAWRSAIARLRVYEAYRRDREAIQLHEASACHEIGELQASIEAYRAELRLLRTSAAVSSGDGPDLLRAQIADAAAKIKALRPVAKAQRQALRDSGRFSDLEARLKQSYLELARMFAQAGLFWGQRQLVEAAHDQRIKTPGPLRMPETWGTVGIQVQGGIAPHALADDPRISISQEALPVPWRGGKPRPRVRLRIGPHDQVAEWPVILHRPVPDDASIRFAKVTVKRVGRQTRWELHLTINLPDPVAVSSDPDRVIAVRPTFVSRGDEVIVAQSADLSGPLPDYAVHPAIGGGLERARGLQAVRDKGRDQILAAFAAWRSSHGVVPDVWPSSLARWESCDKLRLFVTQTWARQRTAGDDAIYTVAAQWAAHDAHLWDWERHAVARAIARRLHLYRVDAARLADAYDVLVIPNTNFAAVAVRSARPERESGLSAQASRQRTLASPGLYRQCLVQAFQSRGKQVIEVAGGMSPQEMLRERHSGVEKAGVARVAKFAKRHVKPENAAVESGAAGASASAVG